MLKQPKIRAGLAVLLLLVILSLFGYYIDTHPAIILTLRHLDPYTLVALLAVM
jgi:hypothetical protein